ncbi:hypothetical protein [Holzapfeliella floricola]|uniref:hypothetical protein n=1 Tax=Holzapfeliella floricola TaxID=679249 RepID=UPI000B1BF838|nr:hypothetical protein [Holzapfeliella floricola]
MNKNGLPIYGLTLTLLGGLLSLFSSIYAPGTVYLVLTSLSGFAVVSVWLSVGIAQLRFRKQFLKEGHKNVRFKIQNPLLSDCTLGSYYLMRDFTRWDWI